MREKKKGLSLDKDSEMKSKARVFMLISDDVTRLVTCSSVTNKNCFAQKRCDASIGHVYFFGRKAK